MTAMKAVHVILDFAFRYVLPIFVLWLLIPRWVDGKAVLYFVLTWLFSGWVP